MSIPRVMLGLVSVLLAGGCASTGGGEKVPPTVARFFLENTQGQGTAVVLPRSQVALQLNPKPVLTEGDVVNVELVQVDLGRCLLFQLTPSATRDFYRLTVSSQGRRLALFIDGAPVGARRIDGPVTDGGIFIFLELPEEELPALVERLKRTSASLQRAIKRQG